MKVYEPEVAPDPTEWLALDEQARITAANQAHVGRFPDALHSEGANPIMHAALHAVIETQIATGEPAITRATLARLQDEGLKRHPAVHALMQVFAEQLAGLGASGARFDHEAWAKRLTGLRASDVVALALGAPAPEPGSGPPMNRAERRAAKRRKR
ncbi:MAG: DUF1841 family protein [Myxococcota bacterium]